MERAKTQLKDLKLMLSEAVMSEDSVLSLAEIKKAFKIVKDVEVEIEKAEEKKESAIIDFPKLPRGNKYNGFPRILYATVCELYSRDKYYSIYELIDITGSSRTQVKNDLYRLEQEGFITLINRMERGKTKLYKYKPTKL